MLLNLLSLIQHSGKKHVRVDLCSYRFVEDDSCMFAVIIDDNRTPIICEPAVKVSNLQREESEDSTIDFPVEVNANPLKYGKDQDEEVLFHYGDTCEPVPVFSVDEKPLDGPSTLTSTLKCPVKYISKIPPSLVTDNLCFICDGDEVAVEDILTESHWWKQTSSSTRFYSSDNMTTFHQVTLITCRGEMRGAYRSRVRGGGITKVSLHKVFRVSRFFSSWRTCPGFHRIVSVINPVTQEGEKSNKFKKRIFIQYFWRSEKPHDRALVTKEYLDFRVNQAGSSPRTSLVPPPTSAVLKSSYPWTALSAQSSRDSLGNISPRSLSGQKRASLKFRTIAKSLNFRAWNRRQSSVPAVLLNNTGQNNNSSQPS
ncbi:hypothetical protein RB195_019911 [Necator americanus]|uniref:SH3 domain protein n=1 Tax=Necator americanus TaxID=51031 RepID=A0ABR1CIS5_NECAM